MTHPIRPYLPVIFLPVSDLKRSIEWYCELFELPVLPKHDGGGIYYFGMQGTDLILDSNMKGLPPMTMFDASDIDGAYAFCRAQGYAQVGELFRYPNVAHFSVGSNMVCQCDRAYVDDAPHPLLPRIAKVFAHVGQTGVAPDWYETFVQRPRERDALIDGCESIRMERGADLLFDDGTFGGTAPTYFERLQLALRADPAFLIESPDAEAALSYVRSKGGTITQELEAKRGVVAFQFADPDGNGIMVAQKASKEAAK